MRGKEEIQEIDFKLSEGSFKIVRSEKKTEGLEEFLFVSHFFNLMFFELD